MEKFTPTADQLAALQAFSDEHGRNWKVALRKCWETGHYGAFATRSGLLQQVRNQSGPYWLGRFILPKPSHDPVKQAREMYASDDITIDLDPVVSPGDDGTWVQAWVWVPKAGN